jgi:Kef-type K+ transport system membrane component KefB
MIASHNFLEDLAFVLSVAALVSIIFQALQQHAVVGYLVGGVLEPEDGIETDYVNANPGRLARQLSDGD